LEQLQGTFETLLSSMQASTSNQLQQTVTTVMNALSTQTQQSLGTVLQNSQAQLVAMQQENALQTRQLIAMLLTSLRGQGTGTSQSPQPPDRSDPNQWGPGDKDNVQCWGQNR